MPLARFRGRDIPVEYGADPASLPAKHGRVRHLDGPGRERKAVLSDGVVGEQEP